MLITNVVEMSIMIADSTPLIVVVVDNTYVHNTFLCAYMGISVNNKGYLHTAHRHVITGERIAK